MSVTAAIVIDVTAFCDVAAHGLLRARTQTDFEDVLHGSMWAHLISDWTGAHREYREQFERYVNDPDTLNYRDQRARHMRQRATAKPRRR